MTRRSLLEWAARVAAFPSGARFLEAWGQAAQGHRHGSGAPAEVAVFQAYRPQFFALDDFAALQRFTEILIPTDDTPGAHEAYCACFMDFVLHSMTGHSQSTQQQWRAALQALRDTGFHEAAAARQLAIVEEISRPERQPGTKHPAYSAYRMIKRENVFAFYTARTGMISCLDYRGNSYNVTFPGCGHAEHHRPIAAERG